MKFTIKRDNKLKGAYGETDLDKGTIRINPKYHKTHPTHKKRYPDMLDTKVHEMMHAKHPTMTEKAVRKKTPKLLKRMSKKQKQKVYSQKTLIVRQTNDRR